MSTVTKIEWTEVTWNPTTGCDRISPGCDHCYALTLAKRLKAIGQAKYQRDGDPQTSGPGFGVAVHEDVLAEPLRWRKPRKVFVNSMSDFSGGVTILVSSFPQLRAYALSFLRLRHVSRPGVSASLQQFGDPVGRDVEIVDDVQASAAPIGGLGRLGQFGIPGSGFEPDYPIVADGDAAPGCRMPRPATPIAHLAAGTP